jgi:arsenate reductase
MTDITIYHNPACGTSRNTLALIRNSGADPRLFCIWKRRRHAMS